MAAVKKTWNIDQDLVRRARRVCGARTETETVTIALREMVARDEIYRAFRRHGPVLKDLERAFPGEGER